MFNLKLYTIKERRPSHDENILLFGTMDSFGSKYLDIPICKVEYQWVVLDENGNETGTNIVYDASVIPEPNMKLLLLTSDGYTLDDKDVYATIDDIDELYQQIDKL